MLNNFGVLKHVTRLILLSQFFSFEVSGSEDDELPEPFLLPFGPKNGDRILWGNYQRPFGTCSKTQELLHEIRFGSNHFNRISVCSAGTILLTSMKLFHDWWGGSYSETTTNFPMISPFLNEEQGLQDNLIDYGCLEIVYYQYTSRPESICNVYKDELNGTSRSTTFRQWLHFWDDYGSSEHQEVQDWENIRHDVSDLNVQFDDYISSVIFGKDTKYINLAGNMFFREIDTASDLTILTDLIVSATSDKTFQATWGFVVTWYKISLDNLIHGQNSYQTVFVCDTRTSNSQLRTCFTLFDFHELELTSRNYMYWFYWYYQYENNLPARSGFSEKNEILYELPLSGTLEVRNLWALSNVDIPGIWIFKIGQNENDPAVEPVNEFSLSHLFFPEVCKGQVTPNRVSVRSMGEMFQIPECSLPSFTTMKLRFEGSSVIEVTGRYDVPSLTITGFYPNVWEVSELVRVHLLLDGETLAGTKTVFFYWPRKMLTTKLTAKLHAPGAIKDILVSFEPSLFQANESIQIVRGKKRDKAGLRVETEAIDMSTIKGSSFVYEQSDDSDLYSFVSVRSDDGKLHATTLPIMGDSPQTCNLWLQQQSSIDLSRCVSSLTRWHGCPRQLASRRWRGPNSDASWAHEEVRLGFGGWRYDICCNNRDSVTRDHLNSIGYCDNSTCEFNIGADFCIISPRLACIGGNTADVFWVSNQCCYNEAGDLLREGSQGAGSMDLQLNSMTNLAGHFWSELEPYRKCCINSDNCETYYRYRPTVIGNYWPRNIIFGRGDPDIQTVDGISYPFMGLGVFTLLVTTNKMPTEFHVSMRRVGDGTVFSGFAIEHNRNRLECFINESGIFQAAIEGAVLELGGEIDEYILSNISVRESEDLKTFTFEFVETSLVVRAVITDNFLNIMTSVPPTFKNHMKGLMGFFDGNKENDFTAADGSELSTETDYETLHNEFGMTWKVDKSDWLFSVDEIRSQIQSDIDNGSPFTPVYDISFDSEEQRLAVVEACRNDTACMRDVALTGSMTFATNVFQVLEEAIEDADEVTQLYRENEPEWAGEDEDGAGNQAHSSISLVLLGLARLFYTM